ncbi:hypothetical protein MW887_009494 [Aspergillus wentii]|nr:hypothetical protein MW887_009494 [Aspergillus wentii]
MFSHYRDSKLRVGGCLTLGSPVERPTYQATAEFRERDYQQDSRRKCSRSTPPSHSSSLKVSLERAREQGSLEGYEIPYVLGIVLDAMADTGVSDISHDSLYKPVCGLFDDLSGHSELHLAHTA